MFDKLQNASRLNDNGAYPYLRSHPLTTERIADMQARQALIATGSVNTTLTPQHAMMVARARVLSNPGVDALRALLVQADAADLSSLAAARQAGVLYGAALAASQLRDFANARGYLERLSLLGQLAPPAAPAAPADSNAPDNRGHWQNHATGWLPVRRRRARPPAGQPLKTISRRRPPAPARRARHRRQGWRAPGRAPPSWRAAASRWY